MALSKYYFFGMTFLVTLLLAACGGSSDGNRDGFHLGTNSASYLFYLGSLNAVDSDNPASPIVVEPGEDIINGSIETVVTADYDPLTKTSGIEQSYALIYAKSDGRLYKVNALKERSLIPERLSSESNANQICTPLSKQAVISDYNNPGNSQYLYSLPGVDAVCGTSDDLLRMVRLGMSANDSPIEAKKVLRPLIDLNNGGISGWLVNDAGALKTCDANFRNCGATIANVATDAIFRLDSLRHEWLLLEIDQQFFIYNIPTRTLSPPRFTRSSSTQAIGLAVADGSMVYLADEDTLYQFPADGSDDAVVLWVDPGGVGNLKVTTNKVIYKSGDSLKAVDKTGGAAITLVSGSDNLFYSTSGDLVYYSYALWLRQPPPSVGLGSTLIHHFHKAGIVSVDGNILFERDNAQWVFQVAGPRPIWVGGESDLMNADTVSMMLASGGGHMSGNSFPGATLQVFNAKTAQEGAVLGVLPNDDGVTFFFCKQGGEAMLCHTSHHMGSAAEPSATVYKGDVYFVNKAEAGSLLNITNTPGKPESSLY